MGKNFEKELNTLEMIYNCALNCDTTVISSFLEKYREKFFLLVGSGGSYSVAVAVEYFCTRIGILAKSITPLELSEYKEQLQNSAVILFTARGRNSDSKNAYTYLSTLEPCGLLTVCMNINAPIKKIQVQNIHNYYFEYSMPVLKDGYLAVESLISAIVILSKAFSDIVKNEFFILPKKFIFEKKIEDDNIDGILKKETIIILYSGITKSAVVDLESKFCEVALGNVQMVDFRNFAHGRHFWISKRMEKTSIIAFIDNENSKLAEKTLNLLPREIPLKRLYIEKSNIRGVLEAFAYVFEIVNLAGKLAGIDPGRPTIEEFGKKLYHISSRLGDVKFGQNLKKDPVLRGVYRKTGLHIKNFDIFYQAGRIVYNKITNHIFKGIIFDYDGTLHANNNYESEYKIQRKLNELLKSNIKIGIATGRGKSVRNELQNVIDKRFWDQVIIEYYNGGCIGTLNDLDVPNKAIKNVPSAFNKIIELIEEMGIENVKFDGIEDKNPYQLTVITEDSNEIDFIYEVLQEISDIKILRSGHSIDIVPVDSSKNNILKFLELYGFCQADFLRIGDSGFVGGNDFELLNSNYGISVDLVSKSLNGCWNFAPLGKRNLEATENLLDKIIIMEDKAGFIIEGI